MAPADAGHDAEIDFRLSELGGIGRDDEIAEHGEFAASAERPSRDRGDHRLAHGSDAVVGFGEEVRLEHVHVGLRRHLLDVGARREGAVGSGQHDASHGVVAVPCLERSDQFLQELAIQRIERFRPVQRDDADRTVGCHEDVLVGHEKISVALVWRIRNSQCLGARSGANFGFEPH